MSSRPTVVGGFILGALALGIASILFFGGMRLFATTSRAVVFFSEPVAGLDVGSPVTFHGAPVGSVQHIAIRISAGTLSARVPVYLELEPNQVIWEERQLDSSAAVLEDLIRAGLRAQLSLQSLVTGQLRVDLDFWPDTPAQLVGTIKDVPEIPTVSSELGQLRNQLAQLPLRELADAAQGALTAFGRLSDHLNARLDPLIDSAHRTADAATQTLQTTDEAIREAEAEVPTVLRHLDSLLVDAHRQLEARGGELGRTLAAADRTLRRAEALLDSLNGLAEPRSQFRGDLEAAVRDLAASARSLRNFGETIERNPNALLMGRGRP
jgi:paraquat-inducible protein B